MATPESSSNPGPGALPAGHASFPTPCQKFGAPAGGHVTPCFVSIPLPMGVSDLGYGASGAYSYATTSFVGTLTLRGFSAFSPGYPGSGVAPDWARVELNTVAVNVSLASGALGMFWIQNGVHLNTSGLYFEDNVWNFSGPNALISAGTPGTLTGSVGTIYRGEFYYGIGPKFASIYPVTLRLYNNITSYAGHVRVYFNYSITEGGGPPTSGSYDNVTFTGTASLLTPPQFLVNGTQYNPAGRLYDAELVIGGDTDGGNANVVALNATATLESWNGTALAYQNVRSAYDFGADSGETALGVAVYYRGTTEYLSAGPSIPEGLWNASGSFVPAASPGWIRVALTLTPIYALAFATSTSAFAGPLVSANLSYAPSTGAGQVATLLSPPPPSDPYVFAAWADGYANASVTVSNNSTGTQALSLVSAPAVVDAPVYLDGDLQAAAFGAAGVPHTGYSSTTHELWLNQSVVSFAPPFLRVNDYDYPTFMLLATQGLSGAVSVHGLGQDPLTVSYSHYATSRTTLVGWSQGYFFFQGTGQFSVSNVTISGNTTLYHNLNLTIPPGTVEFYHTNGSQASNVTATSDAYGVSLVSASNATVTSAHSTAGACAVLAVNSRAIRLVSVSATGTDSFGSESIGGKLVRDGRVNVSSLSAAQGAYGLISESVVNLTLSGFTVSGGTPAGLVFNYTNQSTVENVALTGGTITDAGFWNFSVAIHVRNVSVDGVGFDFLSDTWVQVSNLSVSGLGSSGVDQCEACVNATFASILSDGGAFGVNVSNSTRLTFQSIQAVGGSLGVSVENSSNVKATDLVAQDASEAFSWDNGANGTFSSINVSSLTTDNTTGSAGVDLQNVTGATVSDAVALGMPRLQGNSTSPATLLPFLAAPVVLGNSTSVHVENVTTVLYPYAVWANFSSHLNISRVQAWYGINALNLFNVTNHSSISAVFAYGSQVGIVLNNTTNLSLTSSTIENCPGPGLSLSFANNSTNVYANVTGNNFLSSHGASASGSFQAANDQVNLTGWYNTSGIHFLGNFWSDRTAGTPYRIGNNSSLHDTAPAPRVLGIWLEFVESGLPDGTNWSVTYLGHAYYTLVPPIYVPGWTLLNGEGTFTVPSVAGYKQSPSSGSVLWAGVNATVSITFRAPNPYLLPLWEWAVIGAGVVAVVVVLLLRRRRMRPRSPEPTEDTSWLEEEPAAAPTPPQGDRHSRRYG